MQYAINALTPLVGDREDIWPSTKQLPKTLLHIFRSLPDNLGMVVQHKFNGH